MAEREAARDGTGREAEMAETGSVHATRFEAAVKVIQSLPKNGECSLRTSGAAGWGPCGGGPRGERGPVLSEIAPFELGKEVPPGGGVCGSPPARGSVLGKGLPQVLTWFGSLGADVTWDPSAERFNETAEQSVKMYPFGRCDK